MNMRGWMVGALAACAAVGAMAKDGLKVGDSAPKLQVGKWVQGEAVKSLETGTVYIVEFWSTWCGPCRASIPHLNEIWKANKDKGLVVIGQNVWEEEESGVEKFVKKMGEKMTYRVALDDKSKDDKGAMAKYWMEAAGQDGIPAAFVVDKAGKIAWVGHPMDGLDKVVEQVLAGTFDAKKFAEQADKEREKTDAAQEKVMELGEKLGEAMEGQKWDDALKLVDQMQKELPEEAALGLSFVKFQVFVMKKDEAGAYKLAGEMGEKAKDQAEVLNELAWAIATSEGLKNRDLGLAEKLASRANEVEKGENAAILDTYARVLFMKGEKDKAIELQTKAVEKADDDMKDNAKATLESYKAGKLPPADDGEEEHDAAPAKSL